MIRVLHVFGKMNRGGAEMRTIALLPLLADKGVQFDFCALSSGEGHLDKEIRQLGGKVFTCPMKPGVLSFGYRFKKLLARSDYDVVHSHIHNFSGYIVKLAYKAGIGQRIVHFRSMGLSKKLTVKRRLYLYLMRRMIDKYSTDILAVGYGAMEYGWKSDWKSDSRCKVIYNGINLKPFEQAVADKPGVCRESGIPVDSKLVIYVGRITEGKAHDILLDAAGEMVAADPRINIIFAGDGELRAEMENKAKAMGIDEHVHFLGVRTDVPRLLAASDCFVLPSLLEGMPGVILEAIAAGLPVVATDLPGVREIENYTDLITIVPLNDSRSLSSKVLEKINTVSDKRKIKSSFPAEFDLQLCAERLFEVYSQQFN